MGGKNNCDCICHKLGYIYCGPGHCPDHEVYRELEKEEDADREAH